MEMLTGVCGQAAQRRCVHTLPLRLLVPPSRPPSRALFTDFGSSRMAWWGEGMDKREESMEGPWWYDMEADGGVVASRSCRRGGGAPRMTTEWIRERTREETPLAKGKGLWLLLFSLAFLWSGWGCHVVDPKKSNGKGRWRAPLAFVPPLVACWLLSLPFVSSSSSRQTVLPPAAGPLPRCVASPRPLVSFLLVNFFPPKQNTRAMPAGMGGGGSHAFSVPLA